MASKHDGFKDYVLDQLADLRGVTCRAMFGGYGLHQHGAFFGIIHKGRLYFKTDRITAARYRDRGIKPFKPSAAQTLKNYGASGFSMGTDQALRSESRSPS